MQQEQPHQDELQKLVAQLARLDWARGLTRSQIKAGYPAFPQAIYLHLPDSQRFESPEEMLHAARVAASRAEGDFLGPTPQIPARRSIEDGGPPAWGNSPLVTPGGVIDAGSAEDREAPES